MKDDAHIRALHVIYTLDPEFEKCDKCGKFWSLKKAQEILDKYEDLFNQRIEENQGWGYKVPCRVRRLLEKEHHPYRICPICRLQDAIDSENKHPVNHNKKMKHLKNERIRVLSIAIPKFKRNRCYPRQ